MDDDEFRIIEEHDAGPEDDSSSASDGADETGAPEEKDASFSLDIPGFSKKSAKTERADSQTVQEKPQPAGSAEPVTGGQKIPLPNQRPKTDEGTPKDISRPAASDEIAKKPVDTTAHASERAQEKERPPQKESGKKDFSKPIFPSDPKEVVSPEGVIMKQPREKEDEVPTFEKTREDFSQSDILLEEDSPQTPVRDPLFAAHVLSEQQKERGESRMSSAKEPERPIPVPGMRKGGKKKTDSTSESSDPRRVSVVRTYESDVAQALKKGQGSLTKMVMAEERKRGRKKEKKTKERVRVFALLTGTLILLAAAGAVVGGALFYQNISQPTPSSETPDTEPALFLVEHTVPINMPGSAAEARTEIENALSSVPDDLDSITRVRPVQTSGTGEQMREIPLSAGEFLSAIDASAPQSFLRSLENEFVLGAYYFDGAQPFLVLKTDSFENAFSGMLQWETDGLGEEIASVFGLNTAAATTTFTDRVLKNRDIRAIPTSDSLLLFYTFIDPQTLVITTRESTLDEVTRRIYRSR